MAYDTYKKYRNKSVLAMDVSKHEYEKLAGRAYWVGLLSCAFFSVSSVLMRDFGMQLLCGLGAFSSALLTVTGIYNQVHKERNSPDDVKDYPKYAADVEKLYLAIERAKSKGYDAQNLDALKKRQPKSELVEMGRLVSSKIELNHLKKMGVVMDKLTMAKTRDEFEKILANAKGLDKEDKSLLLRARLGQEEAYSVYRTDTNKVNYNTGSRQRDLAYDVDKMEERKAGLRARNETEFREKDPVAYNRAVRKIKEAQAKDKKKMAKILKAQQKSM